MLLTITSSKDSTADYLLNRLKHMEVPFIRIDTDSALDLIAFSYSSSGPELRINGRWYSPDDFTNVWYRRPERLQSRQIPETPEGLCVLDEWAECIDGFLAHIPEARWMNYPARNALASRKLEQLTTAKKAGLLIPESIVTQDATCLKAFFKRHDGNVIVKPLGRAYIDRPNGERDSLIYTNLIREADLLELTDLERCPTYFQQAVLKHSDVRITMVDSEVHAIELIANENGRQRCDIRRNNMNDVQYQPILIPDSVQLSLNRLASFYQLRFAAIDMAIDENGQWFFFEVNPNGQWAWLDICGASSIYKSFIRSFSA